MPQRAPGLPPSQSKKRTPQVSHPALGVISGRGFTQNPDHRDGGENDEEQADNRLNVEVRPVAKKLPESTAARIKGGSNIDIEQSGGAMATCYWPAVLLDERRTGRLPGSRTFRILSSIGSILSVVLTRNILPLDRMAAIPDPFRR